MACEEKTNLDCKAKLPSYLNKTGYWLFENINKEFECYQSNPDLCRQGIESLNEQLAMMRNRQRELVKNIQLHVQRKLSLPNLFKTTFQKCEEQRREVKKMEEQVNVHNSKCQDWGSLLTLKRKEYERSMEEVYSERKVLAMMQRDYDLLRLHYWKTELKHVPKCEEQQWYVETNKLKQHIQEKSKKAEEVHSSQHVIECNLKKAEQERDQFLHRLSEIYTNHNNVVNEKQQLEQEAQQLPELISNMNKDLAAETVLEYRHEVQLAKLLFFQNLIRLKTEEHTRLSAIGVDLEHF